MNKLNVLLIDDNPTFCFEGSLPPELADEDDIEDIVFNEEEAEYKKYFNLHWIKEPREAQWVLGACDNDNLQIQRGIFQLGLPAEILIFDYDLSGGGNNCPKDSEQASNIEHRIKTHLNIDVPLSEKFKNDSKNTFGLLLGVDFATIFNNHYPCGAIPTTAFPENINNDSVFFECNHERNIDFSNRTNPVSNLKELINRGIKAFRERVVKLINSQLININIPPQQLLDLITNPIQAKESFISIYANLGCRHLPVQGIFIDVLLADNSKYEDAATKWADALLEGIFKNHNKGDFFEAKRIAKKYLGYFEHHTSKERYELSEYLGKYFSGEYTNLKSNDANEVKQAEMNKLNKILAKYNKTLNDVEKIKDDIRSVKDDIRSVKAYIFGLQLAPLWSNETKSPYVRRLSALMLMVEAQKYSIEDKNCDDFRETLLRLLDPLPEDLLTYRNKSVQFKKQETSITNPLKRIGEKISSKPDIYEFCLTIDNVLQRKGNHTIKPADCYLLKLYAREIDFDENDWPAWLKNAP